MVRAVDNVSDHKHWLHQQHGLLEMSHSVCLPGEGPVSPWWEEVLALIYEHNPVYTGVAWDATTSHDNKRIVWEEVLSIST